ncbi:MAG TPA: GNAT family protein [Ktedonobacterales bacterium]|nr:GNAT family protein [Ktedonobacterales bacterium]
MYSELRTPRVVLRPYRLEDAEALHTAIQESRAAFERWLPGLVENHQTAEQSQTFIQRAQALWAQREKFHGSLWESSSGRFLGDLSVTTIDWSIPACTLGYWLRLSASGQGYVSEAVERLSTYLLTEQHMQRVAVWCESGNQASIAVAKRLGFVYEGTLRNAHQVGDRLCDFQVYSRIPSDQ